MTTAPACLGSIAQESPYAAAPTRAGQVSASFYATPTTGAGQASVPLGGQRPDVVDIWDTVVKAVVQLENGTVL